MIETSTKPAFRDRHLYMHFSPNLLSVITNAIDNCKVVTIEHDSYEKGISIRDIEPLAIVYNEHRRSLVGWCRLRNDFRSFRLDRINSIKITQEGFNPRPDFRIEDFKNAPSAVLQENYEDQR
jgi:predicted DNA-binding transcriptional regulator YafY